VKTKATVQERLDKLLRNEMRKGATDFGWVLASIHGLNEKIELLAWVLDDEG
jgi:hypothetical protein